MSSQINPIKFFFVAAFRRPLSSSSYSKAGRKTRTNIIAFLGEKKRRNEEAATVISVRHAWLDWWWYHGDRTSPVAIREPKLVFPMPCYTEKEKKK